MGACPALGRTGERILRSLACELPALRPSAMRYLRNPLVIYAALAVAGTALIIAAVAPLASTVVQRWSQRDVELRSRLVFNSIRDQVAAGLASASGSDLVPFFERIAEDETAPGAGFLQRGGAAGACHQAHAQAAISCGSVAPHQDRHVRHGATTRAPPAGGRLSDDRRSQSRPPDHSARPAASSTSELRGLASTRPSRSLGVIVGIGLLATAIVLGCLRGWSQLVRSAIADAAARH